MKKYLLSFLIALVVLSTSHVRVAFADGGAISGEVSYVATESLATPIEGIEITGATGTVPVKLLVSSGSLAMSTTTGLTFDGPSTGAEIYFSGSLANVNAALATLTYTGDSAGSDTLEISLVEQGEVFLESNGHLYEYIPGTITWTAAQTAATALTRYGSTGYLVTITSEEENDFVAARLEGAGWMGASDAASEDTWEWVTGPETGDDFWIGDQGGAVVPGEYENWNTGEPNDSGSNEDCAQFLSGGGQNGQWNDLPCTVTTLPGYVVEFGAPGDLPDTAGESFSITVVAGPTVTSTVPADNATDVDRRTGYEFTLNEVVTVGEGTIRLYQASNDLLVDTVDITSEQVTGWGTTVINVDFAATLRGDTEYYILLDQGIFINGDEGISSEVDDETDFTFTTERSTSRAVTPVSETDLTIVSATASCGTGSATGTVRLKALGANEYLLSNDSSFLHDAWYPFDVDGEVVVPWTFSVNAGEATVYAMVRNGAGDTRLSDSMAITPCVMEEENAEDEPTADEPTADEPTDDGETSVRTGPSPWDGQIEYITDVSGMTLIKGENYDTVYWLQNGKRLPFIRESIYFTWFSDFSDVNIVTDATLQTIPLGSPVLPKSVTLVKVQSVPDVYLVGEADGVATLTLIENEGEAIELFGKDWAKLVLDLDVFLFNKFVIAK